MGKPEGKVAVITGGSSGMALASARRFVEDGAYVFIAGRRQQALNEAIKAIGRNVTGVRGDAANLGDLDRLFDTVQREKARIDVLCASAGMGEAIPLGDITGQHFDATSGLNTRGTLFTAQKALPLFNDGDSEIAKQEAVFPERSTKRLLTTPRSASKSLFAAFSSEKEVSLS